MPALLELFRRDDDNDQTETAPSSGSSGTSAASDLEADTGLSDTLLEILVPLVLGVILLGALVMMWRNPDKCCPKWQAKHRKCDVCNRKVDLDEQNRHSGWAYKKWGRNCWRHRGCEQSKKEDEGRAYE